MNRAVFFDRDGVLNEEVGYLWEIERFKWILGAREAIKLCNERGFLVIVVTNQGGIAKNLYTSQEVDALHNFMQEGLSELGAHIDAFYYCPHHPDFSGDCECRKPKPGLILKACEELAIEPARAIMFGDTERDMGAARAAGLRAGILFSGGNLFEVVKAELEKL